MNLTVKELNAELCMGCGICKGVCGQRAIEYKRNHMGRYLPYIVEDKCNGCGSCYAVCPGKGMSEHEIYAEIGQAFPEDMVMGNILECFNAKIKDEAFRAKCTSGGMVTGLIQFLLKEKIYDLAFCVEDDSFDRQVGTKPQYADSDFEKTAQSRYLAVSHTEMIRYILKNRDKKVIIVATGCVVNGIRNVIKRYRLKKENYLILGLFCSMSLNYNSYEYMKLFSKKKLQKCEFRSKENGIFQYGNMKLIYTDGKSKFLHFIQKGYLKEYMVQERCFYCTDLLAVFSDIAFGDNNTASADGESTTVVVRTETGKKIMDLYPSVFYEKESIKADQICRKGTLKDRRKQKKYAEIYAEEQKVDLYPDRQSQILNMEEYNRIKKELDQKKKKMYWGSNSKNIRKLYWLLQLKMLRLKIFKRELLKPVERKKYD